MTELRLGQYGMGMQEATIIQWMKQEGDAFLAGDLLLEVEAAKTTVEIEAQTSGVLSRIVAQADDIVEVGGLLAEIAEDGEAIVAASPAQAPIVVEQREAPASPAPSGQVEPRARKLAQEHGVDLAKLTGTGSQGRITEGDVRGALSNMDEPDTRRTPLKGVRGTIARKMMQSLRSTAQLTLVSDADVTVLSQRREGMKRQSSISFTEILVPAVAIALRRHPHLNATVEEEALVVADKVNIGLAVQADEGLMVPVLHDADQLSAVEVARRFRTLVAAIRQGNSDPANLSGGTFTITNLGAFGVDAFTPILQAPQVAILGVGRIIDRYCRIDDGAEWRKIVTLSLTFDHRGVDGAPAANFLATIRSLLENPDGWLDR